MKKVCIIALFPLLLSLQSFKTSDSNFVNKEIIITLKNNLNKEEVTKLINNKNLSFENIEKLDQNGKFYLVNVGNNQEFNKYFTNLSKDENIKFIEENVQMSNLETQEEDAISLTGLEEISKPYDIVKSKEAKKLKGENNKVNIALLDTGVNSTNRCFEGIIDKELSKSFSGIDPLTDFSKKYHGSQMTYIIGGHNESEELPSGVCDNVNIISISMPQYAFPSDFVKAISYVSSLDNVPLINCSYGCDANNSPAFSEAIKDYEGLFVCAAGNDYKELNVAVKQYPASYSFAENMIVVGSSDENDKRNDFSNYSSTDVDIFAPGYNVTSWYDTYNPITKPGTSQATAFVTGACALLLSKNSSFTTTEVKNRIMKYADKIDSLKEYCIDGNRLNVYNAYHTNTHSFSYKSLNSKQHTKLCNICDESSVEGHIVAGSTIEGNKKYSNCIYCGAKVEVGFIIQTRSFNYLDDYDFINGLYYPKNTQIIDGITELSYEDSLNYEE